MAVRTAAVALGAALLSVPGGAVAVTPLHPITKLEGCQTTRSEWEIDPSGLRGGWQLGAAVREEVRGGCEVLDRTVLEVRLDGERVAAPFAVPAGDHVLQYRVQHRISAGGAGGAGWFPAVGAAQSRHQRLQKQRQPLDWRFNIREPASEGGTARACMALPPWLEVAAPPKGGLVRWEPEGAAQADGTGRWCAALPVRVTQQQGWDSLDLTTVRERGSGVLAGGPLLAVGAAWQGPDVALRLRAEYEVGLGKLWLPGVAVDWDGGGQWLVAPRVELSTPEVAGLPTAAIGLGAPWRLGRDAAAVPGLRALASLHWGHAGVVASLDRFWAGSAPATATSLLLRASF